jgi:peptidoglycan LD-endopeptidase CwlK
VHPRLVASVMRITYAMSELGLGLIVTDGLRTVAQQAALYARGRTAPGPIVTNCDGVTHRSNHQAHADGLGHAVDLCFIVHGQPSWDASLPWDLLGAMAAQQGLQWGGDAAFRAKGLCDRPHLELPEGLV